MLNPTLLYPCAIAQTKFNLILSKDKQTQTDLSVMMNVPLIQ